MQKRGMILPALWSMAVGTMLAQPQGAPQTPQGPPDTGTTFRTETRLVPVDVVVTDKKGNYVRDLAKKDFKVYEDNKEQEITSFSFGSDPNAPGSAQQRYLVLFFDNSTMSYADQMRARQEAAKFIDANASPERLMAVVNFGGALAISQNFTDNADRLKAAVTGVRSSAVSPNMGSTRAGGGMGGRTMGPVGSYGARTVLIALRDMAKTLADIPGRKILVFFTSGFPLNARNTDLLSELNAAIDSCNHANVAVYPIDVRGLISGPLTLGGWVMQPPPGPLPLFTRNAGILLALDPVLRIAAFQARGGGGGTTGGGSTGGGSTGGSAGGAGGSRGGGSTGGLTGGGTSGGSRGGTGTTGTTGGGGGGTMNNAPRVPMGSPRTIMPRIPDGVSANQELMYALASGTGGFVIANTNDLLKGMQSIGKEQNEYYFLGYAPPDTKEGSCHTIHVKVDRGGSVRARTGYCNVKSKDVLAGKPIETQLETRITGSQAPTVAAPLQAAYFYSGANTARVTVALAIPSSAVKFEKVKGKFHGEISVLGIAYRSPTEVGARFSDTVKLDYDKKDEVEEFASKPYHYENQFEVSPGKYNLKVVFNSGGENFGKQELPLAIETYDGTEYSMSGLAPTQQFHPLDSTDASQSSHIDAELIEGRTPMISGNLEFTPAAQYRFKSSQKVAVYFEIYDSFLAAEEPPAEKPSGPAAAPDPLKLRETPPPPSTKKVAAQLRIVNRQSGQVQLDSGGVEISNFVRTGSPVMNVALNVPVADLKPGGYRLEISSWDWQQRRAQRTVDFDIE